MNQWKRELDGIAGDVSEQKKRLTDGVAKKLHRKKKNRKPVFVGVVAILALALSLFLVSDLLLSEKLQTGHNSEKPVYFDEPLFMYFGGVDVDEEELAMDRSNAFNNMLERLAIEQFVYENGYTLDQAAVNNQIKENLDYWVKSIEEPLAQGMIQDIEKKFNMKAKTYFETILVPSLSRVIVVNNWIKENDSKFSLAQISEFKSNFYLKYADEIAKLKAEQNIPILTNDFSMYPMLEGVLVTYDFEQKRILVGKDTTHEKGVWITIEQVPSNLTFGDVLQVHYESIGETLSAKNVKIIEDFGEIISCENILQLGCSRDDKVFAGFHDSGYASKYNNHFIVWGEDGLHIFGHYNPGVYGKPNDLDMIMEIEGAKEGETFMKVYEDAEITKEENQYIVKLTDELSLTFEIIGPRTIKDTTGAEYTTQMYTEE